MKVGGGSPRAPLGASDSTRSLFLEFSDMGELGQPLATKANGIPSQSCVCCCLWSCSQSPKWRKEMTSPSSTSLCVVEMLSHGWFFEKASFNPRSLCCTRFKHFHIPVWWWLIFIDDLWKILVSLCNTWNAKMTSPEIKIRNLLNTKLPRLSEHQHDLLISV